MKILAVCQHYSPEPFRLSDICEQLAAEGHRVEVITGIPNYPLGKIYDGYRHGQHRDETVNGVHIHRCFTIGRRHGIFWRMANYYSFMFFSTRATRRLKEDFDVVFAYQLSPVMMANAAVAYKKKHGCPLVLYCLDLWPESLVVGGIKKGSLLYRYFHRVSKKLYTAADRILVSSRSFTEYFQSRFGLQNTAYLPQYAEDLFDPVACHKQPGDTVDLMFAGNVGIAQSVDTIVQAAALTKDIPNLRWHIVGDGSELENIKDFAAKLGLTSMIFHGRQPVEEMPRYYAMADAMLVTMQKDPVISLTLPGKVQSYLAAGKPLVGAIDGEAHSVIEEAQCGFCGAAEDAQALADNIRRMIKADKKALGENARRYYDTHFEKQTFIRRLEKTLKG